MFEKFLATPKTLLDTQVVLHLPTPECRREYEHSCARNIAAFGEPDWHKWNMRHWGTGWDVSAVLVMARPHYLCYEFQTDSCPPLAWLRHVSASYADALFLLSFDSTLNAFGQSAVATAGVLTVNSIEVDLDW